MKKPSLKKESAISVKVPTDLLDKVRAKSAETGVAISFVVRKGLEDWVRVTDWSGTAYGAGLRDRDEGIKVVVTEFSEPKK